jgi:hypothetical protein
VANQFEKFGALIVHSCIKCILTYRSVYIYKAGFFLPFLLSSHPL